MSLLEVALQGTAGTLPIDVAFRAGAAPLVLLGPNGAGKTQTLMMILGATRPRGGRVTLDGTPSSHLDVLANVGYGIAAPSREERLRLAREMLRELDAEALALRHPAELSGGETQRVALARALASRPRALLLDEPLAALDISLRRDMRRFLAERLRTWSLPTVVVTHDRADAEALDGDVVVIEAGAVVQRGRLPELAAHPATAFVERLVWGAEQ